MIEQYSPNTQWGMQHVELTLMQWGYSRKVTADVRSNCRGFDVIDSAVSAVYADLENGPGAVATIILENASGDRLHCTDDEERGEDWIKEMVVSAQIVGWTPPTLNEIRKMNGADPLPNGDTPWDPH